MTAWSRRRIRNVCGLAMAAAVGVSRGGLAQVDPELESLQKQIESDRPQCLKARIDDQITYSLVELQPTISARDIERYAQWLDLSDPQRRNLEWLLEQYTAETRRILDQQLPRLNGAAARLADAAGTIIQWLERYGPLDAAINATIVVLRESERQMLEQLQSSLAAVQEPALQRVRMHRARQSGYVIGSWMEGTKIDLSTMIDSLAPEPSPALVQLQREYERSLTPAIEKLVAYWNQNAQAHRLAMIETIADDDGRLAPGRKELGDRAQAAVARRRSLIAELLQVEGQIVKVNREYLPRFVAAIGPEAGNELKTRYRLMAYPSELMLDPTSPSAIYGHALGEQGLPDELRSAFEEQWANYVRERELRIQKMCGVQDKLYQRLIDTGGTSAADRAARNEHWFELQRERLEANRDIVRRLKSMLPADVVSAMRESFDDYGERLVRESEVIELHFQRVRDAEARRRE